MSRSHALCAEYVEILTEEEPDSQIFLSGFSLGGNAALKYLGEDPPPPSSVIGAAVLCVPFNSTACQPMLDGDAFNKRVYVGNFLKSLKRKAVEQKPLLPASVDLDRIMKCNKIGDFDDLFISPIYGFRDKLDYYRKNSCIYFLSQISVPFFVLNSLDDPFFDNSIFPKSDDYPLMTTSYQELGGHCGFMFDRERGNQFAQIELARFAKHLTGSRN